MSCATMQPSQRRSKLKASEAALLAGELTKPSWQSRNEGIHERVSFEDSIWGFDLAGGSFYKTPLRVTAVKRDSRAEKAGIRPGDQLLRINDIDTSTLTIQEAHAIIIESGVHIRLAVSAPDDTEDSYHCWQDEINNPYDSEEERRKEEEKAKKRVIHCRTNANWSLQWPWVSKRRIIYKESNCFMVPSKYENKHRMDAKDKETVTFKHLKRVCKSLFFVGVGNFWPQEMELPTFIKWPYDALFFVLLNIIVPIAVGSGLPVLFKPEYSDEEKTDSASFAIGHLMVVFKYWAMMYQRENIKRLLENLLDNNLIADDRETDLKQTRKAKLWIWTFTLCSIGTISFYTNLGIGRWIDGKPYYTTLSFWPPKADVTLRAQLFRVTHQLTAWVYVVAVMLATDALALSVVICLSMKFLTLINYFDGLRRWLKENCEGLSEEEMEIQFREKFVVGLRFHDHILSCARSTQECFGFCFAMTVSMAVYLVSLAMSRFMLATHDVGNLFATAAFISALLTMLAVFMWNCGDINVQASNVASAMFGCGWERFGSRRVARLVLVGSLQAQRPVVMKAFGYHQLSHAGFVAVVKTSYSVFAVIY